MRSLLAPLSLANLLLIRIWTELLGDNPEPVPGVWYGSALLTLALLTAVIWLVARFAGFAGRVMLAVLGLAIVGKEFTLSAGHDASALKGFAAMVVDAGLRQGWFWPVALVALLAVAWGAWKTQLSWGPQALLVLSPIVLVTAGQSFYRLTQPPRSAQAATQQPEPTASLAQPRSTARVVWIVFDEFDERIAFSKRPATLQLPALDAMRAESVVFQHAISPSNSTAVAIPTLLSDVLERSHRAGRSAGLLGWFLPYCGKYGPYLKTCEEWRMNRQLNSYGDGLLNVSRNQLRSMFESSLYSLFGQSLAVEAHARTILEMEKAAMNMAARPDLDLIFIHLPVPHPPYVYDRVRRDLSATNQDSRGYLASLELADRLLSRIRASMAARGLWESSNVLVMGDHGFRQASRLGYPAGDLQVPFMWKAAGAGKARQIAQPFETKLTAQLVSRILAGETAEGVFAGYP